MAFTDYLTPFSIPGNEDILVASNTEHVDMSFLEKIQAHNSPFNEYGHFDIQKYFHMRGWHITSVGNYEDNHCVAKLSKEMAEAYVECSAFIKFLRSTITKKLFQFNYPLKEHTDKEKTAILHIAKRMYDSGILSNYYAKNDDVIFAKISNTPKVINFINGTFLEIMATAKTVDILAEISENYSCEFDVFPNVHIVNGDGQRHELDVVFYFDGIVFWIEAKSGVHFSDFNQYRELGLAIEVNPNRHLLIASEVSDENCNAVGWFFDCFIANINNFEDKLKQMVEMALIEEGRI